MSKLTNIRTVSVPSIGKLPISDKGNTFTPSGVKREHKPGRLAEDGGYTESGLPARLELSINMKPGVDIMAINAIDGEDVTVRLADGHVHMLSQAWVESPLPIGDGESKLVIVANTSEQIS